VIPKLGGGIELAMFKKHGSFVISYVFLVILPVLVLLGILKYGRRLTAPMAVSGIWRLQADLAGTESLPCGQLFGTLQNVSVEISQSGKNLTFIVLGSLRESWSGVIDGATMTASFWPLDSNSVSSSCGTGGALSLTATVDPTSIPRSFSGTFSVLGCSTCGVTSVHATREEKVEEKKRP